MRGGGGEEEEGSLAFVPGVVQGLLCFFHGRRLNNLVDTVET